MNQADTQAASNLPKPDAVSGRRSRRSAANEESAEAPAAPAQAEESAPTEGRVRRSRSREEVQEANHDKMVEYMGKQQEAVDQIAEGQSEDTVAFDAAVQAMDQVPTPELEKVPRRTRKERAIVAADASAEVTPVKVDMNPPAQAEESAPTEGRVRRSRRTRN